MIDMRHPVDRRADGLPVARRAIVTSATTNAAVAVTAAATSPAAAAVTHALLGFFHWW